jgi:amino acid adenylation domain-containing protein
MSGCTIPTDCVTDSNRAPGTIPWFFEQQAARTPGAIAIAFAEQVLSYRQLDERANRLRRRLETLEVGPETLVGVFMDRSPEMIVALLAILKAGGAYVPLDPAYPEERIAWVIEDSRASVVMTTANLRQRLPATTAAILVSNSQEEASAESCAETCQSPAVGTNLAYVIYTSGSTGKPKGVMVEHRNVLSFFAAMDGLLGTVPGTWLAVTSISFDISVLELFWTLTRGFKVVLHGDEGTQTIASEMVRHHVTHFQSTPSLARMLATDPGSLAAFGSLKTLLLGGEALPSALLGTLRQATSCEILNMYGPTETTVWSTAFRVPPNLDLATSVPIGQPLANNRAYILDSEFKCVTDGESGELYLGGESVVRGYWNRPTLTAERFPRDPFVGDGRMYRTGDVARLRTDGNLEFLGRTDYQVKLRGYRIELGEIETVLERQSAVRQAVVVVREDRPGDQRLVAYIVVREGEILTAAACRTRLSATLPDYMVPAHYIFLDRLPVTPNGKINRNALPAPIYHEGDGVNEQTEGNRPRDHIEGTIVKVWSEVLGIERVGLDENVFDLGATSLMMPEVQLELKRRLGREISLVDLFEYHTVRVLAAHLEGASAAPQSSNRGQLRRAARNQDRTR